MQIYWSDVETEWHECFQHEVTMIQQNVEMIDVEEMSNYFDRVISHFGLLHVTSCWWILTKYLSIVYSGGSTNNAFVFVIWSSTNRF